MFFSVQTLWTLWATAGALYVAIFIQWFSLIAISLVWLWNCPTVQLKSSLFNWCHTGTYLVSSQFIYTKKTSSFLPLILHVLTPSPQLRLCAPLCVFVFCICALYAGAQSAALGPWPPDIEDTCATHSYTREYLRVFPNHKASLEILSFLTRYWGYLCNSELYQKILRGISSHKRKYFFMVLHMWLIIFPPIFNNLPQ